MKYTTPELVVLGTAATMVLGGLPGEDDNPNPQIQQPVAGLLLGLDD
jgi:hypothetical protein